MGKYCDVCKNKINGKATNATDGIICLHCLNLFSETLMAKNIPFKISDIYELYRTNENRKRIFNETQTLKNFNSTVIHIDNNNKLFYIGNIPTYYSFYDVVAYIKENGKVTSKTKTTGGITRAIIGDMVAGPVGAVVGSNLAGSTTTYKTEIMHYLEISTKLGNKKVFIYNPPAELEQYVNVWIKEKNDNIQTNPLEKFDEIKKYKQLLDCGAITNEEFEKQKQEILKINNNVILKNDMKVNQSNNINTDDNISEMKENTKWTKFFLCLFLGTLGVHKFYECKIGIGILYLFTFGIFGLGWFIDLVKILIDIFKK